MSEITPDMIIKQLIEQRDAALIENEWLREDLTKANRKLSIIEDAHPELRTLEQS